MIVDGMLDSKCSKYKEQEGERGDWLDEVTTTNDGMIVSPSKSSRRHLGHINGVGLRDTTAAALRGGDET